ncbi:MAG: hypothetical protein H6Q17_792 [Bacteroidetes bacterium]|nr:hypothetical protein [Bacteroidota bacterium]
MKRKTFILVLCLMASVSGFSQTKTESIKELFHLMQSDSLIDKMFSSMLPSISSSAATTVLTSKGIHVKDSLAQSAMKSIMDPIRVKLADIIKRMINVDMVQWYDNYFTQGEIDDYIRFYKTPSGQKLINSQLAMQQDMVAIVTQKYMPEIMNIIKEQTDKYKNKQQQKKQ